MVIIIINLKTCFAIQNSIRIFMSIAQSESNSNIISHNLLLNGLNVCKILVDLIFKMYNLLINCCQKVINNSLEHHICTIVQ